MSRALGYALVVRFESGLELTVQRSRSAGALELATWSRWPVGRYAAFAAGTRVDSVVAARRVARDAQPAAR